MHQSVFLPAYIFYTFCRVLFCKQFLKNDFNPECRKISLATEKHWLCDFTEESGRNQVRKINKAMKDIGLPEFGDPDNFIDLCDIVESHAKQDSLWAEELAKVTDTIARTSAKIYGTSDEGSNHATTVKHQSSEVPSACGGDQRILRGSDGAAQVSMGPNLRGSVYQLVRV
jgi:hypothetical protein